MWLSLALSSGDAHSPAEVIEARDIVALRMTPEQIAEAKRLAREWKLNAGDALSQQQSTERSPSAQLAPTPSSRPEGNLVIN
jgi:hypothetical protein